MPCCGKSRCITVITLARLHCFAVNPARGLRNEAAIPGEPTRINGTSRPHRYRRDSTMQLRQEPELITEISHSLREGGPRCPALHFALLSLLDSRSLFGLRPLRAFAQDCA